MTVSESARRTATGLRRRARTVLGQSRAVPALVGSGDVTRLKGVGRPLDAEARRIESMRVKAANELAVERTRATLITELAAGTTPEDAVVSAVRSLASRRMWREANRTAAQFSKVSGLAEAGNAGTAISAAMSGRWAEGSKALNKVSREKALGWLPAEVVALEYAGDYDVARATAGQVLQARPLDAEVALNIARTAFGRLDYPIVGQALDTIDALIAEGEVPATAVTDQAAWIRDWLGRATESPEPEQIPQGRIGFAILDYKSPDWAQSSANVGDHVQTIASLGHLLRHQSITVHSDDAALQKLLRKLQRGIREDRQLRDVQADVQVSVVNRDASSIDNVAEGTWMLAFGWYMHHWFRVRYDFPFNANLRPIFISFHLNHPEALNDDAIDYLRRYAPIGCRDWETVFRLLDLGVPAFFSGCLTTTVEMHYPRGYTSPGPNAPIGLVDLQPGREPSNSKRRTVSVRQSEVAVRRVPIADNLRRAYELLGSYQREYGGLVTSRLHCYLPTRSLGVPVTFKPKDPDDIRFGGLIGIDDDEFATMQAGLRDKLEAVITLILGGADESAVRAEWTRVTAEAIATARAKYEASK